MKKLILIIICLIVALFMAKNCPVRTIEPNIIGTGNIEYNSKSKEYLVTIDSIQYPVNTEKSFYPLSLIVPITPTKGMLVTVFTLPRTKGNLAVKGNKSVEDINQIYSDSAILFYRLIILLITLLCVIDVVILLHYDKQAKKESKRAFDNGRA